MAKKIAITTGAVVMGLPIIYFVVGFWFIVFTELMWPGLFK